MNIDEQAAARHMTPESQRIAIAEACGWVRHGDEGIYGCYLNDLNAMHESLQAQSEMFQCHFSNDLWAIAKAKGIYFHQLTAKDWADAFITILHSGRDSLKVNA